MGEFGRGVFGPSDEDAVAIEEKEGARLLEISSDEELAWEDEGDDVQAGRE